MSRLLIFGPGYTASHLADAVEAHGWHVTRIGRAQFETAEPEIAAATHILSSVPPAGERDPVLDRYRAALGRTDVWLGYLSSTGVYGDAGGAWVDESAAIGTGRRSARAEADRDWLALRARVFRLPGIYGPGRSPFERLRNGTAYRVDSDQVFSRIHVDDIVAAVIAAFDAPAGPFNIADDRPATQAEVTAHAARLIGLEPPPLAAVADLPAPARGFYAEHRRVANGRAKRVLGWSPRYSSYREGLRALSATISPASVSAPPTAASSDQR